MSEKQTFTQYVYWFRYEYGYEVTSLATNVLEEENFDDDSIDNTLKHIQKNKKSILKYNKIVRESDIDDLVVALNKIKNDWDEDERFIDEDELDEDDDFLFF